YNKILLTKSLGQKTSLNGSSNSTSTYLRCIEFDSDGKMTNVPSDIKKKELIMNHDLLPRDLRKIDKGYDDIVPSILIRPSSILINILHIKALIKADSVVLFNHGSSDSHTYSTFLKDLERKLKTHSKVAGLPFEIRALEAIFISVVSNLHSEMKVHTTVIKGILQELENHIDRAKLRYLLIQSKKLSQFDQKATLIRDLIDELLEQDDELDALYLTAKLKNNPRRGDDHQEVEMLLESYYKHCDEIVQTVENLTSNIKTTEEIINIILDSNRNQLMVLSLRFSLSLLSFGSLLYVASLYGMNLENFIEEKDYWFWVIVIGTSVGCAGLFKFGITRLNKLQKVTMTG
ncbi:hypothetical protein PACTADRAFT_28980, partial [Pachysolen tannophilus NRRL Y-2460]